MPDRTKAWYEQALIVIAPQFVHAVGNGTHVHQVVGVQRLQIGQQVWHLLRFIEYWHDNG